MQSSMVVLFRAVVMLACLIAIPLAAVLGSAVPKLFRTLLDGRIPSLAASIDSPAGGLRFHPAGPSEPAAAQQGPATVPSAQPVIEVAMPACRAETPSGQASSVVAAAYETPLPVSDPASVIAARPSSIGSCPSAAFGDPAALAQTAPPRVDQFSAIQGRLRELGAVYYLLEAWGNQEQLYRFYCKMAIGGNTSYTRYFEATDVDPLTAMGKVLREVEAWRAAQP